MIDSKVTEVLRTFTKEEFREFENFAASPFHSPGRNLVPLIRSLKKFYPAFAHKNFTKENIYRQLYNGAYNDKKMRPMLSNLLKMSEEFLTQISLRKQPHFMKTILTQETVRRNLYGLTQKNISLAERFAQEYGVDHHYFSILLNIEQEKIDYNLRRDQQILACDDVKNHAKFIIYYFFASISKSMHNLDVNQVTFNANYDEHIALKFFNNFNFEKFISEIEDEKYKEIIQIYSFISLSYLHKKNAEYFFRLKELIFANIEKFNRNEKANLLRILIALCNLKSNFINYKQFSGEYFEIVNIFLSEKLYKLAESDYFSAISFRTIFLSVLTLREYKWLEEFVQKYISEVSPEYRHNLKILCNAVLYFSKGLFDKALKEATRIDFQLFIFKYDVKSLILKIYYEKNYIEEALYGVDSYVHFISKNKNVSEIFRLRCMNFIKTYKKLLLVKSSETEFTPETLRNEISENPYYLEKNWLLEKIDELES
jgi:hypothetical protein